MYQFNGWIEIVDDLEDPDGEATKAISLRVESMIRNFGWSSAAGEIAIRNGSFFLNLGGLSNHPGSFPADLRMLLEFIAEFAPGSYGLVHWRDDELSGLEDRKSYYVMALRRGTIVEGVESLLSPIVPAIEI